jgi:hypothetical protein
MKIIFNHLITDQVRVAIVTGVLHILHLIHIHRLIQILMDQHIIILMEVATTMETIITASKDNDNKKKCKWWEYSPV